MRLTETLTIPDELEAARAAGDLVIFAGAGVSVPPPSNLPNFVDLAKKIAEPLVPLSGGDKSSLDKYLGRAAHAGLDVQARARDLLSTDGQPTSLHKHLLALFGAPERLRLVTTNFDSHFSTALDEVYPGANVPMYVGPALPPGQNFRGIAQLHGSLKHQESKLILTDQDFAEAYMAEGWASRFLARLFADRAVLFVGYSLSDPIMQYLLHGIPSNGRWYALWPQRDVDRGVHFRVTGIRFGKSRSRNPYTDLNRGVELWRRYASMTSADHAQQIRDIARKEPPASPLDADYLRTRLATVEGRAMFCAEAKGSEWFKWIAADGYLNPLLNVESTERVSEWIDWCLTNYCDGASPLFLRFAREHSLGLHRAFADSLLVYLWRGAERLKPEVVKQFVALLARSARVHRLNEELQGYLITALVKHGHIEAAFALLRAATIVELAENLPYERLLASQQSSTNELIPLTSKVGLRAAPGRLEDFLESSAITLVAADPLRVLNLAEGRLLEAYEILHLASGGRATFDSLSYSRDAIVESQHRRSDSAIDVLVDLARLSLEELVRRDAADAFSFASRHEGHDRALLTRLALFAYSILPVSYADEFLRRAGTMKWLADWQLRPECYAALKAHFPYASPLAQDAFIALVTEESWWSESFDGAMAQSRLSLALFLARIAPDSQTSTAFAERERSANPTGIEADTDGLRSRTTAWEPEAPPQMTAADLGLLSPETALLTLQKHIDVAHGLRESHSLMAELQLAIRAKPTWGIQLVMLALEYPQSDRGIVESALFGLREAVVLPVDQLILLRRLRQEWRVEHARTIGSVLLKWCEGLDKVGDELLLDAFDAAADVLYERSSGGEAGTFERGWTERAINHAAGYAAQIWWKVASTRDWIDGEYVPSVDAAERNRWLRVLADTSPAGDFARPILGMATDRLSAADLPWTMEHIFPAFSPLRGRPRASQLWDGRLVQTRFFWGTLRGLREPMTALFRESGTLVPSRSRELGDFVALLAANRRISDFTTADLHQFIRGALAEARVSFADALPKHISRLEPSERIELWTELLSPYWRDRRTNMPLKLSPEELAEMLQWPLELPEVADKVVEELLKSPTDRLSNADSLIFHWRDDTSWIARHPSAAVGMIQFLLERAAVPQWFATDVVTILVAARDAGAPVGAVRNAARLLIQEHPQFGALIDEKFPSPSTA